MTVGGRITAATAWLLEPCASLSKLVRRPIIAKPSPIPRIDRPLKKRTVAAPGAVECLLRRCLITKISASTAVMAQNNPFLLAADNSSSLLPLLRSNPSLASKQDQHGYSLLHAAASYSHVDLLRTLVDEFHVDINLKDEDGETCLFVTETLAVANCLISELHIDDAVRNDEGMTAAEKIAQEADFPQVAIFLEEIGGVSGGASSMTGGAVAGSSAHPPPLPPNVTLDVGTMVDQQLDGEAQEPDPEFRRRIEELAASDNFHTEEGQQELRDLITDAVKGVGDTRDVRRRTE